MQKEKLTRHAIPVSFYVRRIKRGRKFTKKSNGSHQRRSRFPLLLTLALSRSLKSAATDALTYLDNKAVFPVDETKRRSALVNAFPRHAVENDRESRRLIGAVVFPFPCRFPAHAIRAFHKATCHLLPDW
jgi:hypothetical protein